MSDHHARLARDDVYDHEEQEPRRRRPVADWGVGDDVFEHMPRGRFSRTTEGPPRERRFAREPAEHRTDGEGRSYDDRVSERPTTGEAEAPQADPPRGGVEDGRRTIVIGKPEDVPSEIAAVTADRDLGDVAEPAPALEPPSGTPAGERRTVKIAGRPEGSLEAARAHRHHSRRRPARTTYERIGARPERLAMWAVALGMLLILLALLTAA